MSCPCPCPPPPVPASQQCRKKEAVCAAFVRLINDKRMEMRQGRGRGRAKATVAGGERREGKCHRRKQQGKRGQQLCAACSLAIFYAIYRSSDRRFFLSFPPLLLPLQLLLPAQVFPTISVSFSFSFLFFLIFSRRFCNPAKNAAQAWRVPRCGSTMFFFRSSGRRSAPLPLSHVCVRVCECNGIFFLCKFFLLIFYAPRACPASVCVRVCVCVRPCCCFLLLLFSFLFSFCSFFFSCVCVFFL